MNISRVEIIDGEEYVKLDFARDMLKEEREYKDNLIKYLEDRIIQLKHHKSKSYSNKLRVQECKYLLERVKSGKYE